MNTAVQSTGHPAPEILSPHSPAARPAATTDPLSRALWLPCTLVLEIPVVNFTVGTLMQLQPGAVVVTGAQQSDFLPLEVNGQLVGLVEFEVVGNRLAVRLTGVA